jgi:hypothetical protein
LDPVTTTIVTYVALKFLDQFLKEEGYGRIKKFLFPKRKYKSLLIQFIFETIDEFEYEHPIQAIEDQIPFYQSEKVFAELTNHVLLKEYNGYSKLERLLLQNPNVIVPTEDQLQFFYETFVEKIRKSDRLQILYVDENYKTEIFGISRNLDLINSKIDRIQNDISEVKERIFNDGFDVEQSDFLLAFNKQVTRQLKKQINSEKYLKNTFIETGDYKDSLRFLCHPFQFSVKLHDEIAILDFRYWRHLLQKNSLPDFKLGLDDNISLLELSHSNLSQTTQNLKIYLQQKKAEIEHTKKLDRSKYPFEWKINGVINRLTYLSKRVALITESAGQGKTNFLCDFTENFLLGWNIPTVFITGSELDEGNIRNGITKAVFPDKSNIRFDEFMDRLRTLCDSEKKCFVIVLDGINENLNPSGLSKNLESFISELIEYDFVRFIISCRSEYFENNFKNLNNSSFKNEILQISNLLDKREMSRRDDFIKDKLVKLYLDHFNIKIGSFSHESKEQLSNNFLLLRIFCEAYASQSFPVIGDIYKEELFKNFFDHKCEEINRRLKNDASFNVIGNFDIKNFISDILSYMIKERKYVNVGLDQLIEDEKSRSLYTHFLDENILVRRDLSKDDIGIFTDTEVVNFTFDEFRDYLISRYLIEQLFVRDREEFEKFLSSEFNLKSPILEGCSTFLFYISRRNALPDLNEVITKQSWFESTYFDCIFNVRDSNISDEDIAIIKDAVFSKSKYSTNLIWSLLIRIRLDLYQKLNIQLLFIWLRELDSVQYKNIFISSFGGRNIQNVIEEKALVDQIGEILEKRDLDSEVRLHNLFELLIYMFLNGSWEITSIYEEYHYRYEENSKRFLRKALSAKNKLLVSEVNRFIKRYEIGI